MVAVDTSSSGGGPTTTLTTEESILRSVKKLLGIVDEDNDFDSDIVIHINSVFLILNQMGIGPDIPFTIDPFTDTAWTEFITEINKISIVKSYVYLKVKLLFDPPTSSILLDAIKNDINELEFRLLIQPDLATLTT